jgi:ACS family glucarate transporter-like MFS transporter
VPNSVDPSDHPQDELSSRPTCVRYLVIIVSMLMAFLLYLDRFCVSFAADYIREDLDLTQAQMGWFLSAFFWSYALAQVPSGWLSDRYGARIMLVVYILSWSFFNGMIGAVYSLALLISMRLLCGLGQAGAYPTSASIVSKWIPFSGRGSASALIALGGRFGGALAPPLTGLLIVFFVPMSVDTDLKDENILHGPRLCALLTPIESDEISDKLTKPSTAGNHIRSLLSEEVQLLVAESAVPFRDLERQKVQLEEEQKTAKKKTGKKFGLIGQLEDRLQDLRKSPRVQEQLVQAFNLLMPRDDLYSEDDFKSLKLNAEAVSYLKQIKAGESLDEINQRRFNRFLLEAAFRGEIGKLYVKGWRPVMYVYGFAGLFVAGAFWFAFRSRPEAHPWSNAAEHAVIASGRPPGAPSPHGKPGKIPFKPLLKSRSMWLDCFMQVGTNIGWVFLVTWLPRYLLEVHNVPILQRGVMAMIPLLAGIVAMFCGGLLTDYLVGKIGLLWGRRLPMMATRFSAALAYALCLWFSTFPTDSWMNSPWMFTAAFALVALSTDMGTAAGWAFKQDVGGRYVGSILGWGNMWGNLGAACSPLIYNAVLGETPLLADWNTMFMVCMGAFIFAGFCGMGIDATIPIAPPDEDHDESDQ